MAYFTLSDVINRVKARLGTSVRKLELSDQAIADLIMNETMATFSIYFPTEVRHDILSQTDKVDGYAGRYWLKTDRQITTVSKVFVGVGNSVSGISGNGLSGQHIDGGRTIMEHQSVLDITSAYDNPTTHQFIPPNQVEITPAPKQMIITTMLHVKHESFETIPPGLRERFMKLAEYDVKIDLLGIRKYFTNISTTFGELELNTEMLEDANDKRDELLELFRTKMMHSANRQKVWVA